MKSFPLFHPFRRACVAALLAFVALGVQAKPPALDTKYSESYINANLVVGKTTMQQVRESFGEPTSRDRTRGMGLSERQRTEETWQYDRTKEKAKPGLLEMIQRKSGAVVGLLGRGAAANAASDVHYDALHARNQIDTKTGGAKELLGVDQTDDPDAVVVLSVYFKNGVVEKVAY